MSGGLRDDPDSRSGRHRAPMTAAVCYSKLVIICQAAADVEGCMQAYHWMKARGHLVPRMALLATYWCWSGCSRSQPSPLAFCPSNSHLLCCSPVGCPDDAFGRLQEDGVQVTSSAYSRLVAVLAKAGQWRRCLEAVRWMRADGLRPDTVTCGDLVSCLSAAGMWDAAMEELDAIMSDTSGPSHGSGGGVALERQVGDVLSCLCPCIGGSCSRSRQLTGSSSLVPAFLALRSVTRNIEKGLEIGFVIR